MMAGFTSQILKMLKITFTKKDKITSNKDKTDQMKKRKWNKQHLK